MILIPGISGSVLTKDGKAVWSNDRMFLLQAIRDGLDSLQRPDGASEDWDDGVEATEIMPTAHIIPGFYKIDGYTEISRYLQSELALKTGQFFEFPYDWRKDNRLTARKLEQFVGDRLDKWRRASGNAEAKAIFVVHSMGGLVARYFIECLGGWTSTRALISFGTPYRGSLDSVGYLANGYARKVGPFVVDATAPMRSFTSVYQLMPTYPCVSNGSKDEMLVADVDLPNVNRQRCVDALDFHNEIKVAQANNAERDEYRTSGPKLRLICGVDQPTFQTALLQNGTVTLLRTLQEFGETSGDGTVPSVSSVPREMEAGLGMFVPTSHSSLQTDNAALAHCAALLKYTFIDDAKFRAPGEGMHVGFDLDGSYEAGQPFEFVATGSEYRQSLNVDFVDQTGVATKGKLWPEGTHFKGEFRLDAGIYHATISGQGVRSASDIFAVF